VALIGEIVYGLVPVNSAGESAEHRVVAIAADFLHRIGERVPAVVGAGPVATGITGLADARRCADRTVRVLCAAGGRRRVARFADIYVETLMIDLGDLVAARGDRVVGPVARLAAYDREHNTKLVPTLRAWLAAFGNVAQAAAAVYVHPNTFRYRLRRLIEIGGLDLDDPDSRFNLMVELRILASTDEPARDRHDLERDVAGDGSPIT
jgi:DNA-binding PucR family transcriptional regulator